MNYEVIKVDKKEDALECNKLLTELIHYEKKFDNNLNEEFIMKSYHENFYLDEDRLLLLVKDNNKSVGYLYGFIEKTEGICLEKASLLDALFIEEEYRHKGIGKELINKFISWSKDNNCKFIDLKVMNKNKEAINLYHSLGFNDFKTFMRAEIKE